MKPFSYFLENGDVKKVSVDLSLAKSLAKDMLERAEKVLMLDITLFSKIVFENIYDSLRDFADAVLAGDGYKSYSHQASFAYLAKYGFEEAILDSLDRFRYKRNGSKYYGSSISVEEAKEIVEFYNRHKAKMEEVLNKKF